MSSRGAAGDALGGSLEDLISHEQAWEVPWSGQLGGGFLPRIHFGRGPRVNGFCGNDAISGVLVRVGLSEFIFGDAAEDTLFYDGVVFGRNLILPPLQCCAEGAKNIRARAVGIHQQLSDVYTR